tara:strand:- start:135 stop:386 length:252 start_codon:yes stop_codon:yes gene_type:complete
MKVKLKRKLNLYVGCGVQHTGWPCNSCFHTITKKELGLKHDIHDYWEAILDFRGDYDDYDWPIEIDTSRFPELIDEFYNKLPA